ncbi:NDC1 family protein [Abortiporus biennis]
MSTPSTPIRAIASSLSLRSAASLPPPSQIYEPLVKNVLQHRLIFGIFLYSAAFSWASTVIQSVWLQQGNDELGLIGWLWNLVSPTTLVFSTLVWSLGVLPIVVIRKAFLTATPTPASSPSQVFHAALSKSSTVKPLLTYISSALILTVVHISMSYIYELSGGSDPKLTLFVKSKKHPYYLNGRTLYLLFSQIVLASFYLLRNILLDRFSVRWTASLGVGTNYGLQAFRLAHILTGAFSMLILAALSITVHTSLFALTRSVVLPILYKVPILSRFLRPFSAHFLRGSFSLVLLAKNWSLVWRTFVVAYFTAVNWEFAEGVFDSLVAEPIVVSHLTADAAVTLISGISSSDLYYKHFAYSELKKIASEDSPAASARRSALFADQKHNPTLWATFARETLLTLGRDYQLFLRRGKPAAPVSAPPATIVSPAPTSIPKTPLLRSSILKQSRSSPLHSALDTLAADGVITTAVTSTTEATISQVPDLFRSVIASQDDSSKIKATADSIKKGQTEVKKAVTAATDATKQGQWKQTLCDQVSKRVPKWCLDIAGLIGGWWRRDRLSKVVESYLPNRKLDALAIDTISSFVCTSLTEDKYGVVQRDIPRIVEALLSYLQAIEDYQNELHAKNPVPTTTDELQKLSASELADLSSVAIEIAKASDVLGEVSDALKDGVVKIVQTFGDKLTAFKFPLRTSKKLQGFVDYN